MSASIGFSASSYGQDASFGSASGVQGGAGFAGGFDAASAGGFGGASSSSYESSSFSSGGGAAGGFDAGFAAGGYGGGQGSSYESSSYSSGAIGGADSEFAAVDTNRDGSIDQGEFRNFIGKE